MREQYAKFGDVIPLHTLIIRLDETMRGLVILVGWKYGVTLCGLTQQLHRFVFCLTDGTTGVETFKLLLVTMQ